MIEKVAITFSFWAGAWAEAEGEAMARNAMDRSVVAASRANPIGSLLSRFEVAPRSDEPEETALRTDDERDDVDGAGRQDDGRARPAIRHGRTGAGRCTLTRCRSAWRSLIISVMSALQKRAAAAGSIIIPTASSVPSAWKPPTRLRTTRPRKIRCVGVPARLTERRKVGSTHSRTRGAVEHGEREERHRSDAGEKVERVVVEREHRSEQDVEQVHVGAAQGNDGDPERQGKKVEGGKRRILLEGGQAGDEPRHDGDDNAGDEPAHRHGRERKARDEVARRRRRAGSHGPWRRPSGSCVAA